MELAAMVRGSSLCILAGHGLTLETIDRFVAESGISEVHFGSAVRLGGRELAPLDPERLQALTGRLRAFR